MGKVWFITGASRGFGRAYAEEAVAHGDYVVAAMRTVRTAVRKLALSISSCT